MLRFAARTPGAAFAQLDAYAVLALDAEVVVHVPYDAPDDALRRFGEGIDALRGHDDGLPVALGFVGYDAAWRAASPRALRDTRPYGDRCPAAWLARYERIVALDLTTASFVTRGDVGAVLDALTHDATVPAHESWTFTSHTSREEHMASVAGLREAICDGDVYLVNLARMLHAPRAPSSSALAERVLNAGARYGAFIDAGDTRIAAMSMERALSWNRTTGVARSGPIKGTRPRGATDAEDRDEAAALVNDPKERAENAMAVDVHRNDLGRLAAIGSVHTPRLFEAEPHRHVHHLVSIVEAVVDPAMATRELLRAMLPVGSVTGAPKLAAMEHIARYERERRGLYTGVYGAVRGNGSLELAVAIRTLVADVEGLHYGVGGGVVWDSDPAREWEELLWKQRGAAQ
jgi:para-aminobenzoate synthetase component 1